MSKIIIKRKEADEIDENKLCTVYQTNNVLEIMAMDKQPPCPSRYKRISGDYYMDTETGEALLYKKSASRINNPRSLQKSFISLRRIINNNFTGSLAERHLVLTYREHMNDYKKAVKDFKNFWLKFKRKYPSAEYVRIIEPQQSDRFHVHALITVK